jgi:hypothetical protein
VSSLIVATAEVSAAALIVTQARRVLVLPSLIDATTLLRQVNMLLSAADVE